MKFEVGVLVLAESVEDKLLFARRTYALRDYVLPGGGMEEGETPFEAAAREVKEETGYLLEEGSLSHVGTCTVPARNEITFVIRGRVDGKIEEYDREEISTFGFFGADEIPGPITKAHRRCALMYFERKLKPGLIEEIGLDAFELVDGGSVFDRDG